MAAVSKYTWIVTQGAIVGDSSGMVGQIGPPDGKKHARFDLVIREGEHFRFTDARGKLRYSGYIAGEYDGFEPLDEYGTPKGCTNIEYERDGQWSPLTRS